MGLRCFGTRSIGRRGPCPHQLPARAGSSPGQRELIELGLGTGKCPVPAAISTDYGWPGESRGAGEA